jgi:hypothetical protein
MAVVLATVTQLHCTDISSYQLCFENCYCVQNRHVNGARRRFGFIFLVWSDIEVRPDVSGFPGFKELFVLKMDISFSPLTIESHMLATSIRSKNRTTVKPERDIALFLSLESSSI